MSGPELASTQAFQADKHGWSTSQSSAHPTAKSPTPCRLMEKLTPILPCRGRDDLCEPRSAAQADELLAAWTALWHPALVAAAGAMPRWTAAASPPDDPAGHLILLPPTAEPLLPEDWLSHAEHLGHDLSAERAGGRR